MKKKCFLIVLLLVLVAESFCQTGKILSGTVRDVVNNQTLENVLITIDSTNHFTYTNSLGAFKLPYLNEVNLFLSFSLLGYQTKQVYLDVTEKRFLLDSIFLIPLETSRIRDVQRTFSEQELSFNDSESAHYIAGFFQSSKDTYLKTAAYNFSQAWFKIRGYDSSYGQVNINGIPMNKLNDGRPQWSNWGGLNDMFRNQVYTNEIGLSANSFGDLLGNTNISTRASLYRRGLKFSVSGTNKTYKGRIMVSYVSGLNRKGWAIAASGSIRYANEGAISGTPYSSWSGFIAVEKKLNQRNSIYFTGFTSWNARGKSAPMTQEVFDLKGPKYNSYWGFQGGKKRNSRMKEIHEPVLMLTHVYSYKNTELRNTISYQFGYIGNSRLGYRNAMNPDPTYWKYLPSYYLRNSGDENYEEAYLSGQTFLNNGQLNWQNLYEINAQDKDAYYYLFEDRNEDKSIGFSSNFNQKINEWGRLNGGVIYQGLRSSNYAKMIDLLGGKPFRDENPFGEGLAVQNDMNNPERLIAKEDYFNYSYDLNVNYLKSFLQLGIFKRKIDAFASLQYGNFKTSRTGHYKNGGFPEDSFGKGGKKSFLDFRAKAGLTYKFNGRNLLSVRIGYSVKPPTLRNIYSNVRIRNEFSPEIQSENIQIANLSYLIRNRSLHARLTGFYTNFDHTARNSYFFAQGLKGNEADFVNELLTDIAKTHMGIEWSLSYAITGAAKILCAGSIGNYTYSNNPNLYLKSDGIVDEEEFFGETKLKGLNVGGTPQQGYSIGLEYSDPDYWWAQINLNLLRENYLQSAPLLRTSNFYLDSEGIPYIDNETGATVTSEQVETLLDQNKMEEIRLVNLVGGKTWKINDSYMGFFVAINNLFGEVFKSGGFEQSRYASYPSYKADKMRPKPVFGPKFWFGSGTSVYLNFYIKF